jgi:lysophospholipase L1-like esterase
MRLTPSLLAAAAFVGIAARASADDAAFALRNGDRVAFYGDSITQDGGYGRVVEQYVRTRYPNWNMRFYNAGVGGDTVKGGWAGETSIRLSRDLISLKPTVVTVMLGMNDGGYRRLDAARLDGFVQGYRAIVARIQKELPDARITLIRSSPFDDVTRPPGFDTGYDAVLRQLGDAVTGIGAELHLPVVDFGATVDKGLKTVWDENHDLAKQLLPDRVHPNPAGHMVMGACLLRAWHAPALVARVEIDGAKATVTHADNTAVVGLAAAAGGLTWKETDQALPLPFNFDDSNVDLAQKAGADLDSLDSEPLIISGLKPGRFELRIDAVPVGQFTADALAAGINLARYSTPMRQQAGQVGWSSDDGNKAQVVARQMLVAASKGETGADQAAAALAAHDESGQSTRSALAIPQERAFSVQPLAE